MTRFLTAVVVGVVCAIPVVCAVILTSPPQKMERQPIRVRTDLLEDQVLHLREQGLVKSCSDVYPTTKASEKAFLIYYRLLTVDEKDRCYMLKKRE